jgi:hypothetical protein
LIIQLPLAALALTLLLPHGAPSASLGVPVLYIGPDQVLPLTSFVGAAIGVVLMFWNRVVGVFRRVKKPSPPK